MIVGTAGHIDHGKTTLVKTLTGIDTDRLKEEKARGITIELGFAYWPRPSGQVIGFVDVPGHERLVHTMLAGASGIDYVLLAIAADDGVMPQTREHLAILDLLGLTRGAVVLTKSDLVSQERLGEVAIDVANMLAPTGLAGADIIPVSSTTGLGLDILAAHLDCAAQTTTPRDRSKGFRLAVDRSFSLSGAGTVVTGTVLSGQIAVGDAVMVSPAGLEARVRSIHAQNVSSANGAAGQRCALALVGPKIDKQSVGRGDVVLTPDLHAPVRRFDAAFRLLPSERKALGQSTGVKVHHGSAEVGARLLVLRDGTLAPGAEDFVQVVLDRPLAAAVGDRFVVRDSSATRTIGGGCIVDLRPPERHRRSEARRAELRALSEPRSADALMHLFGAGRSHVDLTAFLRDRADPIDLCEALIGELELKAYRAGPSTVALPSRVWQSYVADVLAAVAAFHEEKPDLPGFGQERLRLTLQPRFPAPLFQSIISHLVDDGALVLDRSWIRLPGHEVKFSDTDERVWQSILPMLGNENRFRPPRVRDIAKLQTIEEAAARRLFKLAARRGDVDEVAHDHYFLSATICEMAEIARDLAQLAEDQHFSVAAFRDRLDNGRKVAIQILEFFDRQGLTMRRGDIRRINPHRSDLFRPRTAPPAGGPDGGESPPVGRPDFKSGEGRKTALGGFDSCLLRQPSTGVAT